MSKYPQIPGYRIEAKLGEGGMATVYLGIQEKLNRKVAIKILEPSLLKNPTTRDRFLIEAETAASISHTNIISIYDIGHVDQYQYIVMEYLKETLKDHMFGYPDFKIKPEDALKILRPISEALDHAHIKGIIHRDIKTDNIMFREDNTPVLVDFGIARVLDSDSAMTKTGISLGTPYYMSPEQCQAEKLDGRSDFYSLGVVFFEIITGEKPYNADNSTAVALKHIQDPVPLLPEELSGYQIVIDKTMAKKREDRVANGRELRKLIDTLLTTGISPTPGRVIDHSIQSQPKPIQLQEKSNTQTMVNFNAKKQADDNVLERTLIDSSPKVQPAESKPAAVQKNSLTQTTVDLNRVEKTESDFLELPPRQSTHKRQPAATKPIPIKKKYPIKIIVESAFLVCLLMVVFIIFFTLGQGTQTPSKVVKKDLGMDQMVGQTRNAMALSSVNNARWNDNFQLAKQYFETGEYGKAKTLVDELKKSGGATELPLIELETKVNNELAFNSYSKNALTYFNQKDYKKARENLLRAQEIKNTAELEALQKRLDNLPGKEAGATKSQLKESPTPDQDNLAYTQAVETNSIPGYRLYIKENPQGRHINEALAKINLKEEEERQKKDTVTKTATKRIGLRTFFKMFNLDAAQSMITRNGFYENEFNKNGDFKNNFENKTISGGALVLDNATGLMWFGGSSSKTLSYKKAEGWVKDINRQQYGGYSNWRMPTLEEAASLLERRTTAEGLHIPPVFRVPPQNIWTGDTMRPQTQWVVRFDSGTVYADSERSTYQVLAVRSME